MDARETLQTYERFDCPPPKRWDRGHLTLFQELPDDLVIERITAKTVPAFARLADYLILTLPLTSASRGLIGRAVFASLSPSA